MRENLEALKKVITTDRSRSRGRFSDELRHRLVQHVEQETVAGESIEKVSRELGLCSKTVRNWLSNQSIGLRKVDVIAEHPNPNPQRGHLSMQGPVGTSVDGLSVDDVVMLWRKLGC